MALTVDVLMRNEIRALRAFKRLELRVNDLPEGDALAIFQAPYKLVSAPISHLTRIRQLEVQGFHLIGVYRRGVSAVEMMDDWRALMQETTQ